MDKIDCDYKMCDHHPGDGECDMVGIFIDENGMCGKMFPAIGCHLMKITKATKKKIRQEAGKLSQQWVKAQCRPFPITLTELAYDFGVKILERYGQEKCP